MDTISKKPQKQEPEIKLDHNQQAAVDAAADLVLNPTSRQLHCIAGRAGRGKTTIVKEIVKTLANEWPSSRGEQPHIIMAAPTGKAAVVMNKAMSQDATMSQDAMAQGLPLIQPASTIHRMLGCTGPGMWGYSKDFPLEADLIIIDEASMVSTRLLYTVLTLISPGCKVLMLGDHGQLKPVGKGNPFLDLVKGHGPYVNELEVNYRQKAGSYLADALENIYAGKMIDFCSGPNSGPSEKKHDLYMHECEDKEKLADALAELIYPMYKGEEDYLCMSPRRTEILGCTELSTALQERLNPPSGNGVGVKIFKNTIRTGDKVRHNKNSYDLGREGVFNGFIGTVKHADNKSCVVEYPGWPQNEQVYYQERKHLNCLQLGYVVTTHTAQGDQAEKAIYVAHSTNFRATGRKNLYVGCSRAKDKCHIIGQKDMVKKAIGNRHDIARNTYLEEVLAA